MSVRTVFLFPGLGAYSAGVLRKARQHYPQIDGTFAEIDAIAAEYGMPAVSDVLFGQREWPVKELLAERAELLQLAIFGISVATHRVLVAQEAEPYLLVGHSFGEMAALVAAGAFSLGDGARLVCARVAALRGWEGRGAMAAIGANERTVHHLIGLIDQPELVVGCVNAPRQTVIAGPVPAIGLAEETAAKLGLFAARLHLPYASHHPSMLGAVEKFAGLMAGIRQRPLERAVFSPVHGRRYTDADDLLKALADCLVLPVRFLDTIRQLHSEGCTLFVESGALNALTRCVELTVPDVCAVAPLSSPDDEVAALASAALASAALASPALASAALASAVMRTVGQSAAGAELSHLELSHLELSHLEPGPLPAETRVTGQFAPPAAVIPAARAGQPPPAAVHESARRGVALHRLRVLYAETLEYPIDALTEDAELEADLGIDSLKQTSLLAKVAGEFDLPGRPAEMRVWDYPTLGRLADHIVASQPRASR